METNLEECIDVVIGIDLGTTYSCVGVYENNNVTIIQNEVGNRTTPSQVAFTSKDRLIGNAAKNQSIMNPTNTIFDAKRMIGRKFNDETLQNDINYFPFKVINDNNNPKIEVDYHGEKKIFSPEEISSMILTQLKKNAEDYLGRKVTKAIITVPAYFNDSQRQATKDAGKIAGLEVLRIINEPTAAAIAYGLDRVGLNNKETHIMVYDFGGGTLDVSLLVIENNIFEVKATAGDTHLGGEDIDNILVDFLKNDFKKKTNIDISKNPKALGKLKNACENAKRHLSLATNTNIDIDSLAEGIDYNYSLTRAKFEQLCINIFKKALDPVKKVLNDSGISKEIINDIVLVGGSTRIPKIQNLLKDFFGKELSKSLNPDEAVAYGAAIHASSIYGLKKDGPLLVDVAPLSLGIETAGGITEILIKRNTPIPTRKEQIFSTFENNQPAATVKVFEGERQFTKDNRLLGKFVLTGIPPAPKGVPKIKIIYEIDVNGILLVTAMVDGKDKIQKLKIDNNRGTLTEDEIKKMINDAEIYKEFDELEKMRIMNKNKLSDNIIDIHNLIDNSEDLSEFDREEINQELNYYQEWLENNQNASIDDFNEKINKLLEYINSYESKIKKADVNENFDDQIDEQIDEQTDEQIDEQIEDIEY
jgi:L1 cell adhesion molecule like protein